MATCSVCKRTYFEDDCPYCTTTDVRLSDMLSTDNLLNQDDGSDSSPTAFLVDLVSNRKIPITIPRCKVGRDDLNDIVISGDQSISRFHFVITCENGQYFVQDSKSRHGTFLNGNQITGPLAINDGDVLKVGVSLFWFVIENQIVRSSEQFAPVDVDSDMSAELAVKGISPATPRGATSEVDLETTMPALQDALKKAAEEAESRSKSFESEKEEREEEPKSASAGKSDGSGQADNREALEISLKEDKVVERPEGLEPPKEGKEAGSPAITASMLLEALEMETKKSEEAEPAKNESAEDDKEESPGKEAEDKEKKEGEEKNNDEPVSESKEVSREKEDGGVLESKAKSPEKEEEEAERRKKSENAEPSGEPFSLNEESALSENGKDTESDFSPEVKGLTDEGLDDILPAVRSSGKVSTTDDRISDEYDWTESPPESKGKGEQSKLETDSPSSQSTLEKLADIVEGRAGKEKAEDEEESKSEIAAKEREDFEPVGAEKGSHSLLANEKAELTSNGATGGMTMTQESTSTNVPQWCTKYFATELNQLNRELDSLNEQVREAQQKIKEVENRVVATKTLRNTLLTATGEDLVEACGKVLARLGWKVKIVEDDKQELRLEHEDKIAICRIIWTDGLPERSHLGQLSIAQTRYYIDQGAEPKGILIAAQAHEKAPPKLSKEDYNGDLADYASKKNLCLMTTLQLLALYREIALNEGNSESLRTAVYSTNGWLAGYALEPSDEDEKESKALVSA